MRGMESTPFEGPTPKSGSGDNLRLRDTFLGSAYVVILGDGLGFEVADLVAFVRRLAGAGISTQSNTDLDFAELAIEPCRDREDGSSLSFLAAGTKESVVCLRFFMMAPG